MQPTHCQPSSRTDAAASCKCRSQKAWCCRRVGQLQLLLQATLRPRRRHWSTVVHPCLTIISLPRRLCSPRPKRGRNLRLRLPPWHPQARELVSPSIHQPWTLAGSCCSVPHTHTHTPLLDAQCPGSVPHTEYKMFEPSRSARRSWGCLSLLSLFPPPPPPPPVPGCPVFLVSFLFFSGACSSPLSLPTHCYRWFAFPYS